MTVFVTCGEDPVRRAWHVKPGGRVTVWVDASSIGMDAALDVDGCIVEDANWLRKESCHLHINVAEVKTVSRGIDLAILRGLKIFTLAMDSMSLWGCVVIRCRTLSISAIVFVRRVLWRCLLSVD